MSLQNCINDFCKECTYDDKASGTWRQQVTLCGAKNCHLYDERPKTSHPIPKSIKSYYGVDLASYRPIVTISEH
jgi:hypothetical protein